jgi:hypothetical protein
MGGVGKSWWQSFLLIDGVCSFDALVVVWYDSKDSRMKQAIEEAERVAALFHLLTLFLCSVRLLLFVAVCWIVLFVFSLWEFVPIFTGGHVIVLSLVYKRFNSFKKKKNLKQNWKKLNKTLVEFKFSKTTQTCFSKTIK